jgi:hypothetical protein
MAFKITEPRIGVPGITSITSVASAGLINSTDVLVGTIVRADDPTYGGGEFVYLCGVGSLTVGNLVTYNQLTGLTTLAPSTANLAQPVAVSMAANTSTTALGWYQIAGEAVIKKTAIKINPNVPIYLSGTAGRVMSTAASGKQILGARTNNAATVASATSTISVLINRPHAQGATA